MMKVREALRKKCRFGIYKWNDLDAVYPNEDEIILLAYKGSFGSWCENITLVTKTYNVMEFVDIYTQIPLLIRGKAVWTPLPGLPASYGTSTNSAEWISIREQLPNDKEIVLLLTSDELIALGSITRFEGGKAVFHELYTDLPLRVSYWTRMPEFPK